MKSQPGSGHLLVLGNFSTCVSRVIKPARFVRKAEHMNVFLRKWKKYFVLAGMMSCLINLLQLTFSFYMFAIYGSVVQSFSYTTLYSITIIAVFCLAFLAVFSLLRSRLLHACGIALEQSLGKDVMHSMVTAMSGPAKRSYQQGLADVSTLRSFLSTDALFAVFDIPWAPLYLVLIFFFHPTLGLLALGGGIVTLGLTLLQDHLTRHRLARANNLALEGRRFMETMLKNAEVVNAMGMGGAVYSRFDEKNTDILYNQTVASRYAGLAQSVIKSIQVLMNVMIYGAGALFVIVQGFDPGMMIAASIIMGQAISPFMRALFGAKTIAQARDAYNRLHGFSRLMARKTPTMQLPVPQGALLAEKVSFVIGGRFVLQQVSLALEPGEFLGLVGPNGAGKTTFGKVALGIWPAIMGSVRLDGVDIFRWDKAELGPYLGYVPQEVQLFPATVAENIARLGQPDMVEVERVCAEVGIAELVAALPQGYETQVGGKDGVTFSGGQKQRIGLARALYGSPRLLVLDEPNSNLDEEGEAHLIQVLERIHQARSATCIMITHKVELLRMVDKMLMLQNGRVAHYGTRNEVLEAIARTHQPVRPQHSGVVLRGANAAEKGKE